MTYQIYTTEGFVLSHYDNSDANRYISIFTKDLGLIRCHAQGIRKSTSKLKYLLQPFTHGQFSFIRGREVWRVVDVGQIENSVICMDTNELQKFMARIFATLERFLGNDEPYPSLFTDIKESFSVLRKQKFSSENLSLFEIFTMLIVLFHLGYIAHTDELKLVDYIGKTSQTISWNDEILQNISNRKNEFMSLINNAIQSSQL
tara:strand:- start:4075 stop:4683 length:609 start_codon:yes stop_codon:yes gene_type:complete